MLSQTKEELQNLINKVQVLDFVLTALNASHKEDAEKVEQLFKQASKHKLKLLENILRLSDAQPITSIIDTKEIMK